MTRHAGEDFGLFARLGFSSARTSIQWSRLMDENNRLNPEGAEYYHRLFAQAREADVEPFVNLYHFDMPAYLFRRGGWESREVVEAYATYAAYRLCGVWPGDRALVHLQRAHRGARAALRAGCLVALPPRLRPGSSRAVWHLAGTLAGGRRLPHGAGGGRGACRRQDWPHQLLYPALHARGSHRGRPRGSTHGRRPAQPLVARPGDQGYAAPRRYGHAGRAWRGAAHARWRRGDPGPGRGGLAGL